MNMFVMDPMAWRWGGSIALLLLYGWLCGHIWRRERRHAEVRRQEAQALSAAPVGAEALLVAYASQTGQAEGIARETARLLHAAGEPVHLCPLDAVDADRLAHTHRALFIVSTYGEGDPPDNAAAFLSNHMAAPLALGHLHYGLLALGDRQYAHYCGFGRALQQWLNASGAPELFSPVDMDCGDAAALRAWQDHLAPVVAQGSISTWRAPLYEDWCLVARKHLNAGSLGGEVYHLELAAPEGVSLDWESGDLVSVRVPADSAHSRDYSIASIAADGRLHLLIRVAVRADGSPGLASHWLCKALPLGATVALQVRAHRTFRLEGNAERPLILIGNGTGLAGLRSHLRARSASGKGPNWLVFGERQAAHDFLHEEELTHWKSAGVLQHLDLAFSRDQERCIYVQDVLISQSDRLRNWVQQGAAIYVCGSLQGMAQAVDAALRSGLSDTQVDALIREGRYRRDVY